MRKSGAGNSALRSGVAEKKIDAIESTKSVFFWEISLSKRAVAAIISSLELLLTVIAPLIPRNIFFNYTPNPNNFKYKSSNVCRSLFVNIAVFTFLPSSIASEVAEVLSLKGNSLWLRLIPIPTTKAGIFS